MSTFQGLEMAKRALFAQQGALYTTGHNISNANTKGYSRQRVNFETTTPFPVPSRNQPGMAGQIGTGVDIGVVDRIRDKFLDMQYRSESSRVGYWETRQGALSRMEDVLNEPSDSGLAKTMDRFWQSLQDLADHPENTGARSVVAHRGLAMAETLNHYSNSLQTIMGDLKEQMNQSVTDINNMVNSINEINKQIAKIEPHGMVANDLYDERDRLIDQLSSQMNIKVHHTKSGESSLSRADGLVSIELLDESGKSIGDGIFLLDARDKDLQSAVNELSLEPGNLTDGPITTATIGNTDIALDTLLSSTGALGALIKVHGYDDGSGVKGDYPEMMAELDKIALEFATKFNEVHQSGVDANGEAGTAFFVSKDGSPISAGNITVSKDIMADGRLIAASSPDGGSNNADNAFSLAEVMDDETVIEGSSIRKYYTSLIGEVGVKGQQAQRMTNNAMVLQNKVDHSRMSISAVSLDEEISNLVKFQHAYNAAARSMTAIDELLDRVINQMGLVGR